MTAPTVAVTVKLSSIGGPSIAGVTVTARLDKADVYQGFVIPMEVSGVTDATGTVVLPLFPNHPTTGLGTLGSIYTVTATVPGGKTLRVTAQVPNSACSLDAIADLTPAPTLDAAQAAQASASASAAAASGSATFAAGQASLAESYASNAESAAAGVAINAQQIYNSVATANTKATEAATSATNAATSATNAAASATAADASKTAAATSATNAATSATNASTSAGNAATSATAADASKTAAQTAKTAAETAAATATTKAGEASASATAAAGSATTASTHATNASNSATAASTSATNASNSASAAATSATNAGTSATNAANSATSAANNATTASTAQGTASAAATAASGSATAAAGSATAAATSASNAAASATTAQINADSAKGSAGTAGTAATNALALYGSLAAVQAQAATTAGYALSATAQASLAASYAATAGSVAQQDLTGADAAALHRSPNAIVQTLVMDWWKDSDPSWRKRMAGASWAQEPLVGTWLGWHASEMDARDYFGALGAQSLLTGDNSTFTNGVGGWASNNGNGTIAAVNGRLRLTALNSLGPRAAIAVTTVAGQRYRISVSFVSAAAGVNTFIGAGTTSGVNDLANVNMGTALGQREVSFVATGTTTYITCNGTVAWTAGQYSEFDNFTVTPVDLSKNPSGAFYGLTTDGKFYRLWKNFFNATDDTAYASTNFNGIATPNAIAAPDGAMRADKFSANTTNTQHWMNKSSINFVAGVTYTYTVYAKAGELSSFNAFCTTGINTGSVRFDLSGNGVVTPGGGMTGTITPDPRGNGWYICTVTFTSAATASGGVYLFQLFKGGVTTFAGDGTEGMYFVDWQLEVGSASTAFEAKGVTDNQQTETFRGNTADFPALPVAVAEATRVVIYAADQPGRPMWRVLVPATNSTPTITGLAYREGCLAIVGNGGLVSTQLWNFPADKIVWKGNSNGLSVAYSPIKNGYLTTSALGVPDGGAGVVSNSATAVAMTTLPDAPVDPVTGLQVPTIAVATAGGVSVIKHDGSVVNSASTSAFTSVALDAFALYALIGSSTGTMVALKPGQLGAAFAMTNLSAAPPDFVVGGATGNSKALMASRGRLYRNAGAVVTGLALNETTPAASLAAKITDTFNTGWMSGDIRRCLLADVSAGAVSGANMVVNGAFNPDTTGWTLFACTATVSGGVATITADGSSGSQARLWQNVTTVPGRAYQITVYATGGVNSQAQIGVGLTGGTSASPNTLTGSTNVNGGVSGRMNATFVATSTTTSILLLVGNTSAGSVASFSAVSVTEAVVDRSWRTVPPTVYGSLTKTAVASAAQLVAYSGFSATNYLQEAYSADLDFGTGGFTVSAWASLPTTLGTDVVNFPRGSELTAAGQGDFSNAALWTAGAGWTVSGGVANFNGTASALTMNPGFAYTAGKWYEATFTKTGTLSGSLRFSTTVVNFTAGQTGTITATFQAPTGASSIFFFGDSGTGTIDNISLKELQPAWAFTRASAAIGPFWRLGVWPDGKLIAEANDGTTTRTATSTVAYNNGQPFKARLQYDTSGTLTLKVNGEQVAQTTGTPLGTLTNASAVLTVGNSRTLDAAWPGSLALLKVGMTVPTDDAGRWMYAQERAMFQPNAQVTLPDSGSLVDMDYDADTGLLRVASAANESAFSGLVRVSSAPVAAGSITKLSGRMGVKLVSRSTTNPGVDITIPPKNLIEELLRCAEQARKVDRQTNPLDWVGGFTGNVSNVSAPTAIQSVSPNTNVWAGSVLPAGATAIGAQVSGTGLPASTSLTAYEGTTVLRMSAAATAVANATPIAFTDFILPLGMEVADDVSVDGVLKQEGATKAFTRLYDGFRERVRFAVAPGSTAWVRVNARKAAQ